MDKISVFYDHIVQAAEQTGRPVQEILWEVKEQGITGVEIRLSDLLRDKERLLESFEQEGLCISSIFENYNWNEQPDLTYAKQHVDTAYELGVGSILVVPGYVTEEQGQKMRKLHLKMIERVEYLDGIEEVNQMKRCLQELVDYAEEKAKERPDGRRVYVTVEDYDDVRVPLNTTWQLREFLEDVQGLKFTLDCGNFAFGDEDAYNACMCLDRYVVHVHCKDRGRELSPKYWFKIYSRGLATVPVGKGYVKISKILERLARMGYDGYYAIEHFNAKDQLKYIKQSTKFLKSELKLYREVEEAARQYEALQNKD